MSAPKSLKFKPIDYTIDHTKKQQKQASALKKLGVNTTKNTEASSRLISSRYGKALNNLTKKTNTTNGNKKNINKVAQNKQNYQTRKKPKEKGQVNITKKISTNTNKRGVKNDWWIYKNQTVKPTNTNVNKAAANAAANAAAKNASNRAALLAEATTPKSNNPKVQTPESLTSIVKNFINIKNIYYDGSKNPDDLNKMAADLATQKADLEKHKAELSKAKEQLNTLSKGGEPATKENIDKSFSVFADAMAKIQLSLMGQQSKMPENMTQKFEELQKEKKQIDNEVNINTKTSKKTKDYSGFFGKLREAIDTLSGSLDESKGLITSYETTIQAQIKAEAKAAKNKRNNETSKRRRKHLIIV